MANEILLQSLTTTWSKVTNGAGTYVNNGSNDVYVQRNPDSSPSSGDIGVLIMVGILTTDIS